MPTDTQLSDARDLTLQKIGRNVVNFQKMEAMLKFILKFAGFSAPLSKGRDRFEARANLHRTKPMGELVDLAAKALQGETPRLPQDARQVPRRQARAGGAPGHRRGHEARHRGRRGSSLGRLESDFRFRLRGRRVSPPRNGVSSVEIVARDRFELGGRGTAGSPAQKCLERPEPLRPDRKRSVLFLESPFDDE